MKKFITMMTFLIGFNANAGMISVDISDTDVAVGETVTVTINAEDFDFTDMFDFDFGFDNSLFSFDSNSLSSDLALFDGLDPWLGLEVVTQSFGLSFDFLGDFNAPVDGNFTIASFNLTATASGVDMFSLSEFFSFGAFDDYDVAYTSGNNMSVTSQSVPEPASMALFLLAAIALVSTRRV